MKENLKEVKFEFDLPGFENKDVMVKIRKDSLSIGAEKKMENKVQKKNYFHEEKSYRSFAYSTSLPKVNPKKAKTSFKSGKLRIVVPKA